VNSGGRPGSGENQAAPSEAPIRLERVGRPQRPYREFPGKSRLWRSLWRRNGQGPVYEPWVDEAGSSPSFVSPQAGEINDDALQNGVPARPASGPFAGFSPGFPAEFLVAKKWPLFLGDKKFGADGFLPDAGNPCGNPFRV
jgi:hypothetical protein